MATTTSSSSSPFTTTTTLTAAAAAIPKHLRDPLGHLEDEEQALRAKIEQRGLELDRKTTSFEIYYERKKIFFFFLYYNPATLPVLKEVYYLVEGLSGDVTGWDGRDAKAEEFSPEGARARAQKLRDFRRLLELRFGPLPLEEDAKYHPSNNSLEKHHYYKRDFLKEWKEAEEKQQEQDDGLASMDSLFPSSSSSSESEEDDKDEDRKAKHEEKQQRRDRKAKRQAAENTEPITDDASQWNLSRLCSGRLKRYFDQADSYYAKRFESSFVDRFKRNHMGLEESWRDIGYNREKITKWMATDLYPKLLFSLSSEESSLSPRDRVSRFVSSGIPMIHKNTVSGVTDYLCKKYYLDVDKEDDVVNRKEELSVKKKKWDSYRKEKKEKSSGKRTTALSTDDELKQKEYEKEIRFTDEDEEDYQIVKMDKETRLGTCIYRFMKRNGPEPSDKHLQMRLSVLYDRLVTAGWITVEGENEAHELSLAEEEAQRGEAHSAAPPVACVSLAKEGRIPLRAKFAFFWLRSYRMNESKMWKDLHELYGSKSKELAQYITDVAESKAQTILIERMASCEKTVASERSSTLYQTRRRAFLAWERYSLIAPPFQTALRDRIATEMDKLSLEEQFTTSSRNQDTTSTDTNPIPVSTTTAGGDLVSGSSSAAATHRVGGSLMNKRLAGRAILSDCAQIKVVLKPLLGFSTRPEEKKKRATDVEDEEIEKRKKEVEAELKEKSQKLQEGRGFMAPIEEEEVVEDIEGETEKEGETGNDGAEDCENGEEADGDDDDSDVEGEFGCRKGKLQKDLDQVLIRRGARDGSVDGHSLNTLRVLSKKASICFSQSVVMMMAGESVVPADSSDAQSSSPSKPSTTSPASMLQQQPQGTRSGSAIFVDPRSSGSDSSGMKGIQARNGWYSEVRMPVGEKEEGYDSAHQKKWAAANTKCPSLESNYENFTGGDALSGYRSSVYFHDKKRCFPPIPIRSGSSKILSNLSQSFVREEPQHSEVQKKLARVLAKTTLGSGCEDLLQIGDASTTTGASEGHHQTQSAAKSLAVSAAQLDRLVEAETDRVYWAPHTPEWYGRRVFVCPHCLGKNNLPKASLATRFYCSKCSKIFDITEPPGQPKE